MSVPPGSEPVAAMAEQFFPGGSMQSVGHRSWLVSVTTPDGMFSVRQLDPRLPATRAELVREFISQPDLRHTPLLVKSEGTSPHAFDARVWVDGDSNGGVVAGPEWRTLHLPVDLQAGRIAEIAGALGAFHHEGTNSSLLARMPRFRMQEWLTAVRRTLELDERELASEIRKESRARRWLTASRPLLSNAETALEQSGFLRDGELVIAHLDLWGSHIVSGSSGTAAFLDCSTIAAAPAIVDIAQLIARNGNWFAERTELVLNHYTQANAIAPLQRRVLPWLTAIDAIGSCGKLLVRAASERAPLSDSDRRRAWAGADLQLELLQSLAAAFVPSPPRPYRRPGPRRNREAG